MIGTPRVHRTRCDSTNALARDLAAAGAPHGTVVTTGEQTAGRGRGGRGWTAPAGSSVLMSVVLRDATAAPALVPLAAAVALADVLDPLVSDVSIKWPNDVWVSGRKVSGILVEASPQQGWAVLGMGVNVTTTMEQFPPDLQDVATSIAAAGGGTVSVEDVLAALLAALQRWLAAPAAAVLTAWRARDALRGRAVGWEGGSGTAAGIDESGALLVDTAAGRVALDAGEVHLRVPGPSTDQPPPPT